MRAPSLLRYALPPACLSLLFLFLGCFAGKPPDPVEDPPPPAWFADATEGSGVDFEHDPGPVNTFFMPQIVGAGIAVFDFDNDGLLDLLMLNTGGPGDPKDPKKPAGRKNRLYKGLGGGKFKDVTDGCGLDFSDHCLGVAVGDADNDGLPDVAITMYGSIKLFLNRSKGGVPRFDDVTEKAGLENTVWGMTMAFFDFNRDGKLDLFVTNNLAYDRTKKCAGNDGRRDYCGPNQFAGLASQLYRNLGVKDGIPRFEDVSFDSGIGRKAGPGLGVIAADFNGDGWPDLFVANDGKANFLWINQKDGTFVEEAHKRGVAVNAMGKEEANMGIGWADVDGDGLMDFFVTHLDYETNTLWKQVSPGQFRDWTTASKMHQPRWKATGFGTMLADFDRDGHVDAAIVNGAVRRDKPLPESELGPFWSQYGQRNQVFRNDGTGRFIDHSHGNPAFCGRVNVGRGLALGDLDNSGDPWMIPMQIGGRAKLLKNVAPGKGNWLEVRALDGVLKRDSLGAEVRVRAGGRTQMRLVQTNAGYICANDPRAHFGLGKADAVEWVEILWPDDEGGRVVRERFKGGPANREMKLVRGTGEALPAPAGKEKAK